MRLRGGAAGERWEARPHGDEGAQLRHKSKGIAARSRLPQGAGRLSPVGRGTG